MWFHVINNEDRTYTYDAVGNRKTLFDNNYVTYYYGYSTGNRLTDIRTGSITGPLYRQFSYDDAGRVTQKRDGAGTPIYTVTYNGKGRASQIDGNSFAYDANDYRISKNSKLYHLEGENLEATYDSTGVLQDKYLRGVIVDEIVNGYHYNSSNQNDWVNYTFHHDHLNSITALTGHNGTTEETTTYDAFGRPSLTLMGTGNDLLYTGREYDQETNLYYYRARYYDAEIGRFISEDPLGFKAGINFYAYVNNNPVNFNDPDGNCPMCVGAGVSVVTGGIIRGGIEYFNGGSFSDITGAVFDPGAIAIDAALGAVGAGLTNKFNTLSQLSRVNSAAVPGRILGEIGENLAGISSTGKGAIPSLSGTASRRFPDAIDNFGNITEVKNVLNIDARSATQITDFVLFGNSTTVLTRGSATNISAIQGLVDDGLVNIGKIPGINSSGVANISTGTSSLIGFGAGGSSNAAGGGFVLYPSKPNTNMLQTIYAK